MRVFIWRKIFEELRAPDMKTRKTILKTRTAISWETLDETDGRLKAASVGTLLFGSEFQTAEAA